MAWRVVEHDDRQWSVSLAAERRPDSPQWNLVFSFRPTDRGQRSFWATYPMSSASKATLFAHAEQLSNEALTAFLVEHLQ